MKLRQRHRKGVRLAQRTRIGKSVFLLSLLLLLSLRGRVFCLLSLHGRFLAVIARKLKSAKGKHFYAKVLTFGHSHIGIVLNHHHHHHKRCQTKRINGRQKIFTRTPATTAIEIAPGSATTAKKRAGAATTAITQKTRPRNDNERTARPGVFRGALAELSRNPLQNFPDPELKLTSHGHSLPRQSPLGSAVSLYCTLHHMSLQQPYRSNSRPV